MKRALGYAVAVPLLAAYIAFRLALAVAAAALSAWAAPYLAIAVFSDEITVVPDTQPELVLLGILTGLAVFLIARPGR